MNTKQKIFCGVWVFAIIASAQAATTTSGITNKASRFSDVLSDMGATTTDSSNSELAETIRRQRALLDAQADKAGAGGTSNITTANACDAGLRKCMAEKCGTDFTKCAKDSTTVWGNKMDACRRNTKCTGHEYTLLAPEILADRNAAIELSYYNSVVSCGNKYNDCMFTACGKTLEKCLSKSAGDSAMAKCKSIADECKEYDNGLVGRVSGVFGDLRTVAAAGAQKDEKRLYELRDLMRTQCTRFGAMFDERTLDCVYTVNFFAGEDHTLMASKKLYSGDTFQCTPDWFGVDITTYMENAQRLTRSQKGASAAAMGAGLGTAASLWTSGAVGRAIDTQNAEKQAKEACENDGGEWVSAGFNKGKKCDMSNAEQNCTNSGGTWNGTGCTRTKNSGETCRSYSGGKDICEKAHGDKCSYIESMRLCVDRGTEDQYTTPPEGDEKAWKEYCKQQLLEYDTSTKKCKPCDGNLEMVDGKCTDKQLVNYATCGIYREQNCPSDKCQWEPTANNSKGKCVAKTVSSTGEGSNPEKPQNNGSKSGGKPPANPDVQEEKIFMNLTVSDPRGDATTIEGLHITCAGKLEVHSTGRSNDKNIISVTVYGENTLCTIKTNESDCKQYTATASTLKNTQYIHLNCPQMSKCVTSGQSQWINGQCVNDTVKLIWSQVSTKIKVNGNANSIKNITCDDQTLDSNNTEITVSKDTSCTIRFTNNRISTRTAISIHSAKSEDYRF